MVAADPTIGARNPPAKAALPFEPQGILEMRARFPLALVGQYGPQSDPQPYHQRQHVFDFHNGIRMMVSFDLIAGPQAAAELHVSASARPGSRTVETLQAAGPAVAMMCLSEFARRCFAEISDCDRIPLRLAIVNDGIVHFFGPTRAECAAIIASVGGRAVPAAPWAGQGAPHDP